MQIRSVNSLFRKAGTTTTTMTEEKETDMKKIITGILSVAALLGAAGTFVTTESVYAAPTGPEEIHLAGMSSVLGLTDEQKGAIQTILKTEREQNQSIHEELMAIRAQFEEAATATTFDEAAVRILATSQAQLMVELTVSHIKTQYSIYQILTEEQKALAKKLAPVMGFDGRRPPAPQ